MIKMPRSPCNKQDRYFIKGAGVTSLIDTFKNIDNMKVTDLMPKFKAESFKMRNSS